MNTGSTGERVGGVRIKEGWRKMTPGKQENKLEKWKFSIIPTCFNNLKRSIRHHSISFIHSFTSLICLNMLKCTSHSFVLFTAVLS